MKCVTAIIALALSCWLGQAKAAPILYTDQFTGSGSLGTSSFSDVVITMTFLGDTSNAILFSGTSGGPHFYENPVGTAMVSIAGLGTATFTDTMVVFATNQIVSPPGDAEIADFANFNVWGTQNAAFVSYDLGSPIGPFSGAAENSTSGSAHTNLGTLAFTSYGATSTFSATAVPEPGDLSLLALSLASMVAVRRLRNSRQIGPRDCSE